MDLFNVVAKLTLDSTEYEAQVNAVSQQVIPIDDPKLTLDTKEYDENITEAGEEAEEFEDKAGGAFESVGNILKTAGIAVAVAAISGAFKKAIDYTADLGDSIDKGSKRMNISTHAYQQWDHALQQSGGSVSDLNRGLRNIREIMQDGDAATGKAAEAFNTLGISMQKSNGEMKTAEELMDETLTALADVSDADQRGALVDALFGPNSGGIKPLLEEGKEGVRDLLNEADDLNLIMSDEDIQKAVEYGDAVANMKKELEMLQVDFAKNILPVLTDCVKAITEIINFFRGNGLGGAAGVATVLGGTTVGKVLLNGAVSRLFGGGTGGGGTGGSGGTGGGSGGGGLLGGGLFGKLAGGAKTAASSISSFMAANGLWAFTPAAVLGASVAPALFAQNESIERTRQQQQELEEAAAAMKEAGDENADFIERSAAAMGLVKDENGNEAKNILGQSYTQMSDEYGDLLMGLQSRQGAERAKLVLALQGKAAAGNDAWNMLNRYWNGNDLDPGEVQELLSVVTNAMKEQWENGTGIKTSYTAEGRNAPEGWVYNNGNYQRVDENGNLLYGKSEYYKSAGYMDEAGYRKWYEEQTAIWAAEHPEMPVDPTLDAEGIAGYQAALDSAGLTAPVIPVLEGEGNEHAAGAWDIPFDNYPAILHRDEMVLSASQARRYREGGGVDSSAIVAAIQGLRNDMANLKLVIGRKTFGRAVADYGSDRVNDSIGGAESRLASGYGT